MKMRDYNVGTIHRIFGRTIIVKHEMSCKGCTFSSSGMCLLSNVNGLDKIDIRPCVCRPHDSRSVIYRDLKEAVQELPFPLLYHAWLTKRSWMIDCLWKAIRNGKKHGRMYHFMIYYAIRLLEWME